MKPEEAILMMRNRIDTASEIAGKGTDGKAFEDMEMAISALKELQQYREIGTVEECREAVEKQKPKKPIKQKGNCFSKGKSGEEQHEIILICPLCGGKALKRGYPCKCGQAIQWDEDLEDIENGT